LVHFYSEDDSVGGTLGITTPALTIIF
jgi:hypothetical protein